MNSKYLLVLFLIVVPLQTTAEVARSVDKQGNVTFSDKPVSGSVTSERISVDAAAPSTDRANKSRQESQAIIDKAKRSQQQRDSTGQSEVQRSSTSAQDVDNARKQLEKAKVVGEGDRQGKARGGSRLTPEYNERVKAAEDNLRKAQDASK